MATEAKKAGNARHVAKLDLIKIQPYREEGAVIREAATTVNMSLQAYILQAVREKMQRDSSSSDTDQKQAEQPEQFEAPSRIFRWDYGLSSDQRRKKLDEDCKRFIELCAIRKERDFSEKECLEFTCLLSIHKDDIPDKGR